MTSPVRSAVVTGSSGFVGRHIVHALDQAGWHVLKIDRDTVADALEFFRSSSDGWDLLVHAAAAGAHRAAIDRSPLALAENLELDAAMFQWAARVKPGRVVYLSSSAAYPVILQDGISGHRLAEPNISLRHPQNPDGIYGWIKLTGEKLAGHAREAGVPVTVVRPFSGYGEDQGESWPFGAFAARAQRREDPFIVWGTGMQVRDFIHITDICAAILKLVEDGVDGPVNLGTGKPTTMAGLAHLFYTAAGYRPEIKPLAAEPSGVGYRVADTTLLHRFYVPRISLEEGVWRLFR